MLALFTLLWFMHIRSDIIGSKTVQVIIDFVHWQRENRFCCEKENKQRQKPHQNYSKHRILANSSLLKQTQSGIVLFDLYLSSGYMLLYVLQWGITPLTDNFAEDNYFYVLKVVTGMRPGAGTKSKVCLVVTGDEMDTGVRELNDGVRKV